MEEIQSNSINVSSISNDAQSTIIDVEQNTDEDNTWYMLS